MRFVRLLGHMLAASLVCCVGAPCRVESAGPPAVQVVETDLDAALHRAAAERRPLFVHFTAEWCAPCKELKDSVYPSPNVAERLARFVRVQIDVESPSGAPVARRYDVQTLPVLVFLAADGTEMRSLRAVAAPSAEVLAGMLDEALARSAPDCAGVAAPKGE